jgi:hypothetical protein
MAHHSPMNSTADRRRGTAPWGPCTSTPCAQQHGCGRWSARRCTAQTAAQLMRQAAAAAHARCHQPCQGDISAQMSRQASKLVSEQEGLPVQRQADMQDRQLHALCALIYICHTATLPAGWVQDDRVSTSVKWQLLDPGITKKPLQPGCI